MEDLYGPPLPPGFLSKSENDSSDSECDKEQEKKPAKIIGPQCPANFRIKKDQDYDDDDSSSNGSPGRSTVSIGPILPAGFLKAKKDESNDSDDDASYGPMPSSCIDSNDYGDVIAEVEKRAVHMKRKLEGHDIEEPTKLKREEWMTTPNTSTRNQLGAISRCLCDGTDAEKKSKKAAEKERQKNAKRNEKLTKEMEKYKKSKGSKSLLELHQKEKKKKEKKSNERKPFDRDAELSLRFMDQKQIGSAINKAKLLDSRFSRGASQYL